MTKSTDEHEQLRGFSLAVLDQLGSPFSEESLAPIRTTRSLRGLREAARDMVEMCQDLAADQVAALDARLTRDGFPTLSEMRDRRYRTFSPFFHEVESSPTMSFGSSIASSPTLTRPIFQVSLAPKQTHCSVPTSPIGNARAA